MLPAIQMICAAMPLLVTIGATALLGACTGAGREFVLEDKGRVVLDVVLPPGIASPVVAWKLEAHGVLERTGTIPVLEPGARISTLVSDLTPHDAYEASATASVPDGRTCTGRTSLDVIAGRTTAATVLLRCDQGGALTATFNNCPSLTSISVSPLATDVGGTIALRASAFDKDCSDATGAACTGHGPVTIGWVASAGAISPAGAAVATYTCPAAGKHTLTITASDGHCKAEQEVEVGCEP